MDALRTQPRCLLAEDEALISMELQATLEDAGVDVVGPFSSCRQLSDWLAHSAPDVALLDIHLRDGPCDGIAASLVRRGVPVVICSGDPRNGFAGSATEVVWLEKPTDPAVIRDLIAHLCLRRS